MSEQRWELDRRDERLRREVAALHRAVFDAPPPPVVVERYLAAHEHHVAPGPAREEESVATAVDRGLDLEALELALRLRDGDHLLARKLRALLLVAETLPAYQPAFVSRDTRTRGALLRLALRGLRSGLKLLRGHWLIRRYGLA